MGAVLIHTCMGHGFRACGQRSQAADSILGNVNMIDKGITGYAKFPCSACGTCRDDKAAAMAEGKIAETNAIFINANETLIKNFCPEPVRFLKT